MLAAMFCGNRNYSITGSFELSILPHRYGVSRTAVSLLFRSLVAPSTSSDAGEMGDGVEPSTSEVIPGALPLS